MSLSWDAGKVHTVREVVPGGHLEFGETIEEGAKREAKEEAGVNITNIRIAGVTNDIFETEGKHYITIWVTSQWKSGKPTVMEPNKYVKVGWYNFGSLPKNLFLPWKQLLKSNFFSDIKKLSQ